MAGYNQEDNSELRQLQLYELNLLKTFAEICDKHKYATFLLAELCLGL